MKGRLTADLSAAALRHNLRLLRELLPEGTRLCPVVKADAYGHGLAELLPVLSPRVDALAVATGSEALRLRDLGYEGRVLQFFGAQSYAGDDGDAAAAEELVAAGVTLTVGSEPDVPLLEAVAERLGARPAVHLKVDTGMGRSGVRWDRATETLLALRSHPVLRLEGVYTHFATADAADRSFAREQLRRFLEVVERGGGRQGLMLHAANSAATLDLPESRLDLVRPGILVYGIQPSDTVERRLPLRPVLRLWADLIQIKEVSAGSGCSYGLEHVFDRDSRLGLVPVGYADGYLFRLSNRASMRVRGRLVPVRGRVTMDQVIVDLTEVPEAEVGDEVEILADRPEAPHSAAGLAAAAGTIPYEVVSRLGPRIRRRLIEEEP